MKTDTIFDPPSSAFEFFRQIREGLAAPSSTAAKSEIEELKDRIAVLEDTLRETWKYCLSLEGDRRRAP